MEFSQQHEPETIGTDTYSQKRVTFMPHYCMNIWEENDSQIKHKSQPSQHIILQFIVLLLGINL